MPPPPRKNPIPDIMGLKYEVKYKGKMNIHLFLITFVYGSLTLLCYANLTSHLCHRYSAQAGQYVGNEIPCWCHELTPTLQRMQTRKERIWKVWPPLEDTSPLI
jgi:hypothetical protein